MKIVQVPLFKQYYLCYLHLLYSCYWCIQTLAFSSISHNVPIGFILIQWFVCFCFFNSWTLVSHKSKF